MFFRIHVFNCKKLIIFFSGIINRKIRQLENFLHQCYSLAHSIFHSIPFTETLIKTAGWYIHNKYTSKFHKQIIFLTFVWINC